MSRLLPALGAAGLLAVCLPADAAPALTDPDKQLLAGLAEAYHLSQTKGHAIWPGFELERRPVALYDRNRVAFLLNHPRPPKGFVKLASPLPLPLATPVYVRYGRSPEFEKAASLSLMLNGTQTAVLPYPFFFYDGAVTPRDFVPALFASYIQHGFRAFASYERQAESRFNAYPIDNLPNMAMADLENKMLAVALQADSQDLAKRNALWFVAMRRERQERLGQPHAAYEDQAEAVEGSTRFAEVKFVSAASTGYQPLRSPHLAASVPLKEADMVRQISGLLHQTIDPNALRRDRFSLTGAAMALLLDRFGAPRWRQELTAGAELDELLARAIDYSDAQRKGLLREAERVYAYARTLKELEDTVGRMPTSLKAFNASPGLRVTVTLPPVASLVELDSEPSRSGRDGLAIASAASPVEIDASTLLASKLDAFDYKKGTLSLWVKSRPILMRSTDLAWPFQNVSFYAEPERLKITVDGQTGDLQQGSRVFTRGLKIEADGVLVKASRGTLVVQGKDIKVIGR